MSKTKTKSKAQLRTAGSLERVVRQRVTITLEDGDDGKLGFKMDFSPDVDATKPPHGVAVLAAMEIFKFVTNHSE